MLIRENKHWLPPESYKGRVDVAFTACTKGRIPFFVEARIVGKCVEALLQECVKEQCDVFAYVFMPDHCHLLLRGKEDTCDVLKLMKRFKQRTG